MLPTHTTTPPPPLRRQTWWSSWKSSFAVSEISRKSVRRRRLVTANSLIVQKKGPSEREEALQTHKRLLFNWKREKCVRKLHSAIFLLLNQSIVFFLRSFVQLPIKWVGIFFRWRKHTKPPHPAELFHLKMTKSHWVCWWSQVSAFKLERFPDWLIIKLNYTFTKKSFSYLSGPPSSESASLIVSVLFS